jgi:hypothetical protein
MLLIMQRQLQDFLLLTAQIKKLNLPWYKTIQIQYCCSLSKRSIPGDTVLSVPEASTIVQATGSTDFLK